MYQLNNLKPAPGAKKNRKRVGRGPGSGHGKTSTRGQNGQGSRSGGATHPWFEGGQMPLYRRVPKKGFVNPSRVETQVVNVNQFERFDAAATIDVDYLKSKGQISGRDPRVKVLGDGDLSGAYTVRVHAVSKSAREKIEAAGGTVEILSHSSAKSGGKEQG
jgi:large subunit ribosomal protein L15